MSISVMAMVWKADLPSSAKLVLLRLADFANDDGGSIFPAVSTVAVECGMGERTVQDQLRALEAKGVLCLVREAVCATRRPREYRIDMPTLAALPRAESKASKRRRENGTRGATAAPGADTAPGATTAPVPRDSRTSPVQQPHQSPAAAAPNPPVYPSENPSGEPPAATPPCGTPPTKQAVVQHVRDLITDGRSYREAAKLLGLGTRHDLIGDLVGSSATGGRRWGDEHWASAANAISPRAASSDQMDRFWSLYDTFQRDVLYATQRIASALGMPAARVASIGKGQRLLSKDEADRFIPQLERALAEERRNPRPRKKQIRGVW
ncbi:MAG TPA: helix-turn-helix domain-containing protein [Magnetospirillum sp.]|nr:helix-turn-helix domain-containing protein [Magnetospirillum sp.]